MGAADPNKYPITNPRLAYAMEQAFKRLIPVIIKKQWLLHLIDRKSKKMSFTGKNAQIGYDPDGPPDITAWVSYNDTLPTSRDSSPVIGYLEHKYIAVPMGYNLLEQAEERGDPNQIIDRMQLRAMQSAWALRRALSAALWSGTGGKQPTGITSVLQKAAPGSQTGSHNAISRTTPWHKNQYVSLTSDFGTIPVGSSIPAGILAIQELIEACTVGSRLPYCLVSTKAIVRNVRRAAMEAGNYMLSMTKREDIDFGVLTVMIDGVSMGWDPECPDDSVYALHLGIPEKAQKQVNNVEPSMDNADYGELDDVEGSSSFYDMEGGLFKITHPNINGMDIQPRSGLRSLGVESWKLYSFNTGFGRLTDHGVLGSDTGSRLSTW